MKEERNINVDEAWNRLHGRLREDDLIPDKNLQVLRRRRRISYAAVLTVFFVAGILMWQRMWPAQQPESFTLLNAEENTVLVTTLNDGSAVYLTQGSSLTYPENFKKKMREVSLTGEALFEVEGNLQRPFIIETQYATVQVTGTVFNIKTTPGEENFELHVQEGTVKVFRKGTQEDIRVDAGESLRWLEGKWEKETSPDINLYPLYTYRLRFKDEALSDLLPIINRSAEVPVVLSDPEIGNRKITVTFIDNTSESMTELICLALKLQWTKRQDTIYISKP